MTNLRVLTGEICWLWEEGTRRHGRGVYGDCRIFHSERGFKAGKGMEGHEGAPLHKIMQRDAT